MSESRKSSSQSSPKQKADSLPPENQVYADELARKLLSLHEENTRIGKQNQELSAKLHDVTTYNQTLGLDLYRLDNEICDLEEKLESNKEKMKYILDQTKLIKKKTEVCKAALSKDEQMSELAKKFQAMQHFKEKADKSVQELQKIFDDESVKTLNNSIDVIAEKIHFLYWNNKELNDQIETLEKLVSTPGNSKFKDQKEKWGQLRIDSIPEEPKPKNIPAPDKDNNKKKTGASLRMNLINKSDSSGKGKNQFSSSYGDNENESPLKSDTLISKKPKIKVPQVEGSSESSSRRARNSRKHRISFPGNEEDVASDTSKVTFQSVDQQKNNIDSKMVSRTDSRFNDYDYNSQLADESEASIIDLIDGEPEVKYVHPNRSRINSNSNSCSDNNKSNPTSTDTHSLKNDHPKNTVRRPKIKRSLPPKSINQESDSEYDYYESEPPPNPKKGTVRLSKNDPEYEYEYYDPEDEEADDEYDFIEEQIPPEKEVVGKAKFINNEFKPIVVKTYTEDEYNRLNFSKPKPYECDELEGERIIPLKKKEKDYDDSPEIITIKKSAKTLEEEKKRLEKENYQKVIRPKKTYEEIKQEQQELNQEETYKNYEERALERALLDEKETAKMKFQHYCSNKDNEELFVNNTIKKIRNERRQKRKNLEDLKDEELIFSKQCKHSQKQFIKKLEELKKNKKEEEEKKIKREKEKEILKEKQIKEAKERIEKRKKEEEENQKQEEIRLLNEKEKEKRKIEEKRKKAKQLKEEELKQEKQRERESKIIEDRNKNRKEAKLKETEQKLKLLKEKEEKEKEFELKEKLEKEREARKRIEERKQKEAQKKKLDEEAEKVKKDKEENEKKRKIKMISEMNKRIQKEKEEEENEKAKLEQIQNELREKRRLDREKREKERKERAMHEKEMRELYDGMIDIPVKRTSNANEVNTLSNLTENCSSNLNKSKNDSFTSDDMSTSEVLSELDVADPITIEDQAHRLIPGTHLHSNANKIKRKRKNPITNENEYDYDYEYNFDDFVGNEKGVLNTDDSIPQDPKSHTITTKIPLSQEDVEKIANEELQMLQNHIQKMITNDENNKSNDDNVGSDDEIAQIGRKPARSIEISNQNSVPNTPRDGENSKINKKFNNSSDFENDDDLNGNGKNSKNDDNLLQSEALSTDSDFEFYDQHRTNVVKSTSKSDDKTNNYALKHFDDNNKRNKNSSSTNIIENDQKPLRQKKQSKPEFIPEYYNVKPQPAFIPIVVGKVKPSAKCVKSTIVKQIDRDPENTPPIIVESIKIPPPKVEYFNPKDFTVIKSEAELKAEAAKEAEREERRKLHAEKRKNYRHTIDANGNEYEYDYEYEYEYEFQKEGENNSSQLKDNNLKNSTHATHRLSDDFLNEIKKETEKANAIIQKNAEILKQRENDTTIKSPKPKSDNNKNDDIKDDQNEKSKRKKIKTVKRVKKSKDLDDIDDTDIRNGIKFKKVNDLSMETNKNIKLDPNIVNKALAKRKLQSARRQRIMPESPTVSSKGNRRLSTRRRNREADDSTDTKDEDYEYYDDEEIFPINPESQNLLIDIDLDSRPTSPVRPQVNLNSKPIMLGADNDEYDEIVEYEYEYDDNDNDNDDNAGINPKESINTQRESSKANQNVNNDQVDNHEEQDFTKTEKLYTSKKYDQLDKLVSQIRADAASLSNEDLKGILTKLNVQIEVESKHNKEMVEKLKQLEKIRDHLIPHNFSRSELSSVQIAPIDMSSKISVSSTQTDVTNNSLQEIDNLLVKQNKEKQDLLELKKRIEIAQQQVISMDSTIKSAEKQTTEKKNAIEKLKVEIIKVKEELAKSDYDTTQDEEQSKQCEKEIQQLEVQVQQSQQRLDKVNLQIQDLNTRLQEMINYRAVLETELNDIYSREKPEVRQLIEDVKTAKQNSEDLQQKSNSMAKKISTKRDEIKKLMNSNERKKSIELRLLKEKLQRRIKKWENILKSKESVENLKTFTAKNKARHDQLKAEISNKMIQLWEKNEQIDSLMRYSNLLESMMNEHAANWT